MKIREGFVSNSSSSSFLIYGAAVEHLTIDGERKKGYDLCYKLEELIDEKKLNLRAYAGPEAWMIYVGRSWGSVGLDETGRQFRESIERDVKLLLGDDTMCVTHEEAWYAG